MRKYGNKKVTIDGHKFDSKMEADYYYHLKVAKDKNEIRDFNVHTKVTLQPAFRFKGKAVSAITYTPDFIVYHHNGEVDYVDVKGVKTNEFRIKEKMFKFQLKDFEKYNMYCLTLHGETWVRV